MSLVWIPNTPLHEHFSAAGRNFVIGGHSAWPGLWFLWEGKPARLFVSVSEISYAWGDRGNIVTSGPIYDYGMTLWELSK